jgi:formate hydrogenlyase subunit 4
MAQNILMAILNLVVLVGLAPLADGIMRKLRARLQARQGPPLLQPYIDIFKLLGKEDLSPKGTVGFGWLVWRFTPILCLGAVMSAALFIPLGSFSAMGFSGDVIAFLYLLALAGAAVILGGFASGNPYAYVGASREMMMALSAEPVMAIALVALAVHAQSLTFSGILASQASGASVSGLVAAAAFLLAIQAQVGKIPFDIAEAETEIMEGPLIERSGPGLALYKLAFQAKTLMLTTLFIKLFMPWTHSGLFNLLDVVLILVVLALIEVMNTANPRLRIDQSMNYFARAIVFVSVIAVAFALIGK